MSKGVDNFPLKFPSAPFFALFVFFCGNSISGFGFTLRASVLERVSPLALSHRTSKASQQMVQLMDSDSRLEAARGVRAIELIQSGDTQQAIQMFCIPVADFYAGYARLPHNDDKTKKLLSWVEQIVSTNAIVAGAIHGNGQ